MGANEILAEALECHKSGQYAQAEQLYLTVLRVEPNHLAAWHLLGRLANQVGDQEAAVKCLERALQIHPTYAEALSDLGTVYEAQGKFDEARECYQKALLFNPDDAATHFNLGNVRRRLGDLHGAADSFREALARDRNLFQAHMSLGQVLNDQGHHREAIEHFRNALAILPNNPSALVGWGFALQQQGEWNGAMEHYRGALRCDNENIDALYNLATVQGLQELYDEAIGNYRRVLDQVPDHLGANTNLGNLLRRQGNLDTAAILLRRAIELEPTCAAAWHDLGIVLGQQDQPEEMAACFDRAVELNPDLALARLDRASQWLRTGDFARGWAEYEWRWKTVDTPMPWFGQSPWKGESLTGKTILIHTEQGFGDTFQFIRYAPLIKQRGAKVIVECAPALKPILSTCDGIDRLISPGEQMPECDFQLPLLSVPHVLETRLDSIPVKIPYLFADPALIEEWRNRLDVLIKSRDPQHSQNDFLVGINWQGREGKGMYRDRDIPWELLLPLTKIPGVRLISLQRNSKNDPVAGASDEIIHFGEEIDKERGAFVDTAAIIKNLDLVISSDTALPHLAGALGAPVWLAIKYWAEWRWLIGRGDSPWYPTMRIFRQRKAGDWSGVFNEIQKCLVDHLEERRGLGKTSAESGK